MLKSCPYCGRIHDSKYKCKASQRRRDKDERQVADFRRSSRWKKKSIEIRQRDNNLCLVCLSGKYLTSHTLTWQGLSVHHIVPVAEDESRALDDSNLITLCPMHHELAESGYIPRAELAELVSKVPPGV